MGSKARPRAAKTALGDRRWTLVSRFVILRLLILANGHHQFLLRLFSGRLRQDDPTGSLRLLLQDFDQDTVTQRLDVHFITFFPCIQRLLFTLDPLDLPVLLLKREKLLAFGGGHLSDLDFQFDAKAAHCLL